MGLDMFLYGLYEDEDGEIKFEKEIYWRKANAIHNWFVMNVQGGEDDCQRHYVTKRQLGQLYVDCNLVLENPHMAPDILPTQSGFFFGSEEYDDYYFQSLKETVQEIDRLKEKNYTTFAYQSWW